MVRPPGTAATTGRRDFLDGPILDFSLGGSWVILPVLRADGAVGYARERPEV